VIGKHADGGVREEHRDKAGDDHDGRAHAKQNGDSNQLADGAPHKAPDHGVRRKAVNSRAVDGQHGTGDQALGDAVKGFGQFSNEHTHALNNDENRHRKHQTGLQDVNRPVGFSGHLLQGVEAEGTQNDAEEHGHHDGGRHDIVMENIQPARQFEIFNTVFFLAEIRRDFISDPRGKLLLVTNREAAVFGHGLRRFVHHVRGNAPVQGYQNCG